jgi:immunoglobulin I-set domain protein
MDGATNRVGFVIRAALAALALAAAFAPAALAQDSRKKQDIIFPELPARSVGDAPFLLAAKATSGLPVTFEVVSGPAVLDGRTLKLRGATGLVIVRATQAGNGAFLAAVPAERAFPVNGRPAAPVVLSQPAGGQPGIGELLTLSVDASGEPKPSFQWRKDGTPIAGATDNRLTIASATPGDNGAYDVVVSNPMGSVTSEAARVSVGKRSQTISFQGSGSPTPGQPIMLSATASSGLPVRFDVVSGVAVISGSVLTCSQGGTVVVQASQGGDMNYAAASPVTQTFLVAASGNAQHFP